MRSLPILALAAALALLALGLVALLRPDGLDPEQGAGLTRGEAAPLVTSGGADPAGQGAVRALEVEGEGAPRRAAAAPSAALAAPTPRVIAGRVLFPAACPTDPELALVALRHPCQYKEFARAEDLEGDDPDEFPTDRELRHGVAAAELARVPVAADGTFRVEVPPRLSRVYLMLRGRHLFLPSARAVALAASADADAPGPEVVLAPTAGAWVRGRVQRATGGAPEGLRLVLIGASAGGTRASMGRPDSFVSAVAAEPDGSFSLRAVPPSEPYSAALVSDDAPGWRGELADLEPGETRSLEVVLERPGRAGGVVVDEGGRPVAGAAVRAWLPGRFFGLDDVQARHVASDERGRFVLEGLAGTLAVTADHPEYLDTARVRITVPPGGELGELGELDLVLEAGRRITGRVTLPGGRPAPDASVRAWFDLAGVSGPNVVNMTRGAQARAAADGSGRFVLRGLGAGPFVVEARLEPPDPTAAGAAPLVARRVAVPPGLEDLELVLAPPPGVAGRVLGADGVPLERFAVEARRERAGEFTSFTASYRRADFEDERGDFFLEDLEEGHWKLSAAGDGLVCAEPLEVLLPRASNAAPVELVVQRAAAVTGSVRTAGGAPVPGATVRVDARPRVGWQLHLDPFPDERRAAAGEDGRFELTDLRPGTVTLLAEAEGFARGEPQPLELAPGDRREDLTLVLSSGGAIEGEVYTEEGERAAGWLVLAFRGTDFRQRITRADGRGEFALEHLTPGEWMAFAMDTVSAVEVGAEGVDMAAMMGAFRMSQATVRDGEVTHLAIGAPPEEPVRVHGRVTLGDEPYPGVAVTFMPEGGRLYEEMETTQVDGEGRYALTLDGPGRYLVSIQALSGGAGQQSSIEYTVEVPEGDEQRQDFALPRGRLSGRVLGPDGRAAGGARVTLTVDGVVRTDALFGGHYTEIVTQADGSFDVKGLRPDTYRLSAGGASPFGGVLESAYGRVTTGDLRVGEDQWVQGVELRLPTPGRIEVAVTDEAGRPLPQATVFVRDAGGRALEPFSAVMTGPDGRCTYGGVAPGEYTLSARVGPLTCGESDAVRVPEGGPARATLRLAEGTVLWVRVRDGAGEPSAASLSVRDGDGREMTGLFGMQDMQVLYLEGAFSPSEHRLGPLPPGRYEVRAQGPAGAADKPVRLRGEPEKKVTLKLR